MFDIMLREYELGGRREAHRECDVLCTRATATILRAAMKHRFEWRVSADIQRADAFRRAELVSRDGQQIEGRVVASTFTLPNACTASV